MTIVILNADCGSMGHTSRAKNYARLLKQHGFRVEEIDVAREDPGAMVRILRFAYTLMLARFPAIWRFLYSSWEHLPGMRRLRASGIAWRFRKTQRTLVELRPDFILTTHAYATAIAATMKAKGKLQFELIVVLGAWHVQPFWCFPEVDRYLVVTIRQRRVLLAMGIPARRLTVSGPLVAPEFMSPISAAEARMRLGLAVNRPILLVMGGGQGWHLEQILPAVARLKTPVCALFFCGESKWRAKLERRLSNAERGPAEIRLLPFEPNPALYFHAADLIITKPGAQTTAQAFASGTPLLAVSPLPGHEEASLAELIRDGAVLGSSDGESLTQTIDRLLADPVTLERTARAARKLIKADTEEIVLALLQTDPVAASKP